MILLRINSWHWTWLLLMVFTFLLVVLIFQLYYWICPSFFFFFLRFINGKGRVTERERKRSSSHWFIHSLSKHLQQPGLGQPRARSQDLCLSLPLDQQRPNMWSVICLPSLSRAGIETNVPGIMISTCTWHESISSIPLLLRPNNTTSQSNVYMPLSLFVRQSMNS